LICLGCWGWLVGWLVASVVVVVAGGRGPCFASRLRKGFCHFAVQPYIPMPVSDISPCPNINPNPNTNTKTRPNQPKPNQPGSKKALRLLAGVEKIKKLLSTIPVAQTQVENVVEGRDIDLHLTREAFSALIEPEVARFRELVSQVLQEAGVQRGGGDALAAVEITGGAMRMPALQEALVQASGFVGKPLGLKLDDNAVAYGAALLLAGGPVGAPVPVSAAAEAEEDGNGDAVAVDGSGPSLLLLGSAGGKLGAERVAALAAAETARRARDGEMHALADVKNAMESFVLELRGMAGHGKHGHLVNGGKVTAFADELEGWLYSEAADAASLGGAYFFWGGDVEVGEVVVEGGAKPETACALTD
jgi:hypothetical protein